MKVRDAQVVVVGAGPVGLMLAGELRLGGADVVVLERRPRPSGESRGMAVHARTREVLDQRGLLDRFADIPVRPAWHFGALPVLLDFSPLDSPHRDMMAVPQARTEAILAEWATELGAEIRRGQRVTGLEQDEGAVTLDVRTAEGEERRVRAAWVVGCDGGRSLVREAAGFTFAETLATTDMALADVEGVELEQRPFTWTPAGFFGVLRIGPGRYRLFVHEHGAPPRPDAGPPPFEEVCELFERLTGKDMRGGRAIWTSRFGDREGQVTRYRIGRVLLAGDAAHVHPPAGGQGLNLGVQDAVNLGWKLAGAVRGWAPDDLLDTYHGERHPTGLRVLENAHVQSRMMVGGAEEVGALRWLLGDLLQLEDVNRHLAGMVTALDVRYDVDGPDHPLVGARLPPRELTAWRIVTNTTHLLRAAHGVLLDLADDPTLRAAARGWSGRVDVVTARCEADDLAGLTAVLVRPDGHVAWVAPAPGPPLEAALRRWFGAPE